MKKIFTILLLLFPILLISQEIDRDIKELSNKMVPEFCGCLQEYELLSGEKFGNCFAANIQKYDQELSKFYIDDTTEVARANNQKFLFDLYSGMQEKLFNDCEEYYLYIKSIREEGRQNLMAIDIKKKTDSLNAIKPGERNAEFHFQKGVLFFAQKQYPQAKDEILKGLKMEPKNYKYKVLLAWVHEEEKNPQEALKIYDEILSETGSMEYVMLKEFAKRNLRKVEKTPPDCLRFHTGKFKILDSDGKVSTIIERTKDHQIETNSRNNTQTNMAVKWLDNCTYVLKYIESTDPEMDEYTGKELRIKIMETTNNSFKFKATMEGVDYIMIEEMVKIE